MTNKYGTTQPVAAVPTLSVKTGTYTGTQSVSLAGSTGAQLYYTVDGSTPTTASTLYTGAIAVSATTTLKVIAVKAGYQNSAVATSIITIDGTTGYVSRSGLQLWLKADSLGLTGGSAVSVWTDQSGSSNDVTQATGANRPTYQTGVINGQPVVRFNGTTQSLTSAVAIKPANITIMAVYRPTAAGSTPTVISQTYDAGATIGWSLRAGAAANLTPYTDMNIGAAPTITSSLTVTTVNTPYLLATTYDGVARKVYLGGVLKSTTAKTGGLTYGTVTSFSIGNHLGTNYLNGDIAEVLVYNRALSDNERQDVEAYVYARYAVGAQPVAAVPTLSVKTGTYTGTQSVSLTGPAGAQLYYTVDGSTPTTASTLYTGAIAVSATTTLKVIAVKAGYQNSAVVTSIITIDTTTSYVNRSGLQLWLKADALSQAGGTAVSAWADQSGNGNDVAQATGANQPTYQTGVINGQPVVRFNGTTQSMASTVAIKPANITIMAVYRPTAAGSTPTVIGQAYNAGATTGWGLRAGSAANLTPYADLNISGTATTTSSATVTTVNTSYLLATTYDSVARKIYLGGVLKASTAVSGSLAYGTVASFTVGNNLGTNYLNGDIAEVLVYNRALSDGERQDVEAYAYAKYAVGAQPVAAVPILSVKTGTYSGTQSVSLAGPTGAQLYYTVDGSTPTTASTLYTGAIAVSATTTLKVIAVKAGYQNSGVASAVITIDGTTGYVNRSGLQLWLKADSLGLMGGSAVSAWADQSGNGNDVTQATGANQPTYQTGVINGQPVVRFNGTTQSMASAVAIKPATITIMAVYRPAAAGSTPTVIGQAYNAGATTGWGLRAGSAANLTPYADLNIGGTATTTSSATVTTVGTPYLLAATYDGVARKVYLGGVLKSNAAVSGSLAYGTVASFTVGNHLGTNYLNGDIAEVLVYNRALSDSERQDVEVYIYAKYAVGAQPVAAVPTLSVKTGTYSGTQSVSLTGPAGAQLYYTLDGSTPTTASTLYTGAIAVSATTTLKVMAVKAGYQNSGVASAVITIDGTTSYVSRSGLQLWLKADSLGLTGGSAVSAWADQSGNGNDVAQATGANQPTYQTGVINGRPVVRFNGTSQSMASAAAIKPANITIMAIYRPTAAGSTPAVISQPYNASSVGWGLWAGSAANLTPYANININGEWSPLSTATVTTVNTPYLLVLTYDAAVRKIYLDGALKATAVTTGNLAYGTGASFSIGNHLGTNYLNGDIAEVLVYDHALSDQDRLLVEIGLFQKYGLSVPTLAAPQLSVSGGTLTAPTQVAITAPTGSIVYYTLDGSTPTISSPVYTGPINVAYSQTIKAFSVQNGYLSSSVVSVSYTLDPLQWPAPVYSPSDHTGPVINLQLPTNAVLQ
ncbi:MAG TPA: chitobiase/beta-hexosaminidase C-terminal domain-containing protein [Roseimicrobium sp.]|nr:chitobiase/beta-hexosaminidase C-terminal domain-containing protein [Roseimicrobium sp.]